MRAGGRGGLRVPLLGGLTSLGIARRPRASLASPWRQNIGEAAMQSPNDWRSPQSRR
jgi:hypothetical protein